jgi:hypothetical protein
MQDQSPELVGESRGRQGVVRVEQVPAKGIAIAVLSLEKGDDRYHFKNNKRVIGGMQKEHCASRRGRGSCFIII